LVIKTLDPDSLEMLDPDSMNPDPEFFATVALSIEGGLFIWVTALSLFPVMWEYQELFKDQVDFGLLLM
jgi:hypothetical protein